MLGFVRPDMMAVGVGANLGCSTLLDRLRRTVAVNGFAPRTTVHGVPLLDQDGPLVAFLEFRTQCYADPRGFLNQMLSDGFSIARIHRTEGVRAVSVERVLEVPGGSGCPLALRHQRRRCY